MQVIFPDYYKHFSCTANTCRHNCCIGWEIDIDADTLALYDSIPGSFGQRLHENISRKDTPHFILGQQERCPFLNQKNLCDIILTLGEDHLCGICSDHPRFRNELPGRVETGLGLCCEEAARLILEHQEPVRLETVEQVEEAGDCSACLPDKWETELTDALFAARVWRFPTGIPLPASAPSVPCASAISSLTMRSTSETS